MVEWALLTNHARLQLAIEKEPELRLRDMANRLGLSERAIALILRDLREAGYVIVRRDPGDGRRLRYSVVPTKPLRENLARRHTVGELLQLLTDANASD